MKFTLLKYFSLFPILLGMASVSSAEPSDISCLYETVESVADTAGHHHGNTKQQPADWYFWRTKNTVEVSNAEQSFGEKWTLSHKGAVFYQALYHDKHFLLDFQPADLKILDKKTNWELKSTLFPQEILQKLEKKNSGKFKNYAMIHYQGTVAGVEYQVDWLPELKLPARVEKSTLGQKIVTELKEIYPLAKSPYKQLSHEKYESMDYADIGDNESHPIVAQLQNNIGTGYFHQH